MLAKDYQRALKLQHFIGNTTNPIVVLIETSPSLPQPTYQFARIFALKHGCDGTVLGPQSNQIKPNQIKPYRINQSTTTSDIKKNLGYFKKNTKFTFVPTFSIRFF